MTMTPAKLDMLIHYYTKVGNYGEEDGRLQATSIVEAHREFVDSGMLTVDKDGTHRGNQPALQAYFQKVLSIPLPVQQWVVPEDETPAFLRKIMD